MPAPLIHYLIHKRTAISKTWETLLFESTKIENKTLNAICPIELIDNNFEALIELLRQWYESKEIGTANLIDFIDWSFSKKNNPPEESRLCVEFYKLGYKAVMDTLIFDWKRANPLLEQEMESYAYWIDKVFLHFICSEIESCKGQCLKTLSENQKKTQFSTQ